MTAAENTGWNTSQSVDTESSGDTRAIPLAGYPAGLPVFEVKPAGCPAGAVVVLQEAFGVDDHIRESTRRLAHNGYHAVAPHLFHRTGDPADLNYGDLPAVRTHVRAVSYLGLAEDLDAVLAYLGTQGYGPGGVAILGFSLGASAVIALSARRALGAAVSFCPGGLTSGQLFGLPPLVDLVRELRTPWLGLCADRDPGVPAAEVERLHVAAAASAVPAEVVRFPTAMHSFYCRSRHAEYDERVAAEAWRRVNAHLRRHVA